MTRMRKKRTCTGRGLVITLIGLAAVATVLLLLITDRSGRQATAQEADEASAVEESVADQIRRLATEGENPQAAVAVATQYLATHPETTLERQRVHYELAASQWFAGDEEAALVTFRQIVAQYANAQLERTSDEYRVDDAVYFIGVLEGGTGNRAAAIAAYEALIVQFPTSNRRPRALFDLGNMYIEDGRPELGLARLSALAQQHPDSEFAPAAIRSINAWLLDPRAWSADHPQAECVAAVKANVAALTAKYPDSIDTAQAHQDLLWYYNTQSQPDQAAALARNMIQRYYNAEPETAGETLCAAATTLLDSPAPAEGDRALATAALVRYVSQRPGASCPPYALYRLALARAEDSVLENAQGAGGVDPNALYEARTLADELRTRYAGTEIEPEALRLSICYLLSPGASPSEADYEQNLEAAKARIDELYARFPDAPETLVAHQDLLGHHNGRYEYADSGPAAERIIERFPNTTAAAEARMELAEVVVELRRDFVAAHELLDEATDWARVQGDVGLEAVLLWSNSRVLVIEKRCAESRAVAREVIAMAQQHEEAAWLLMPAEAQIAYGWFMEEEYARAADEFSRILDQYPGEESWAPFLEYYVGLSWFYAKDERKAKDSFVRLVEDHPENGWAYAAFEVMNLGIERPANLWQLDEGRAGQ